MKKRRRRRKTRRKTAAYALTAVLLALLVLAALLSAPESGTDGGNDAQLSAPHSPYRAEGFLTTQDGRIVYQDEVWQSEQGIDVSEHQGQIDWETVAADGVRFAIIRVGYRGWTDGMLGEDARFRENLEGAQAAGLDTGVYFFSQAVSQQEALEEAELTLRLLDGARLEEPVFFDWEYVGEQTLRMPRTAAVSGEEITAFAAAFCERITAGGYQVGTYFNQSMSETLIDRSALADYPFWLAQYAARPEAQREFGWWQYSDCGSVKGIDAPVDLDLRFVPVGSADAQDKQ